MLKFNEDLSIEHLPSTVYEDLVNELNKNDRWKVLAEYVCEKLEFSSQWIRNLENKTYRGNESPAEKLLIELNIKMCSVGILGTLLENCNLLKTLSILHLPEPLKIISHPDEHSNFNETLFVSIGRELRLFCKAYGLPPANYQWYHEDCPLENQTSEELKLVIKSSSQEGFYRCQASQTDHKGQKIHQLFSRSIFVNIRATPVVIENQPQLFVEAKEGGTLDLCCEATSHPCPQYQWYRNNERLDQQNSNLLRIENFTAKDEGKYFCHIFNQISELYTHKSTVMMEVPRQKAVAKVALLIANENYDDQEKLNTPKNDVAKVAKILSSLGFHTVCLADLTLLQMKNAIKIFSDSLIEGTYGLFYFAGHGFKMQENYMLSIDAPRNYLRKDAICESQLLSMALANDPALFIVVLDMCQTFPPVECNPDIHEEIPPINVYKGQKNLRNLLQAYSTSSYRPSYERVDKDYGLYATHLCKHLDENIPVTKVFEQVGKSIDTWLKGAERKQIPMFATTITKPYRLTDSTFQRELPASIATLEKSMTFPNKIVAINFQQTGIRCKAIISQYIKPFLNFVQVTLFELDDQWEVNFYTPTHAKRDNLFKCATKNQCWIHWPQNNEGTLVISLLENKVQVGATLLELNHFVPVILNKLNLPSLSQ